MLASSQSKLSDRNIGAHYHKLDPYLLEQEAEMTELPQDAEAQRKKAAAAGAQQLALPWPPLSSMYLTPVSALLCSSKEARPKKTAAHDHAPHVQELHMAGGRGHVAG